MATSDRLFTDSNTVETNLTTAGQISLRTTQGDDVGTTGQVLTSNGPDQLPTFQDASGGGGGGGASDFQRFDASGTWTKPTDTAFGTNSVVLIRAWGAGGSGGKSTSSGGSGGGGGGYVERKMLLSELGASEIVTVGVGGAALTSNGNGNQGGDTTFGTHLTGYGGGGGSNQTNNRGGGGGGFFSAGSSGVFGSDGIPGLPHFLEASTNALQGQGANESTIPDGADGFWHGGGGGDHDGGSNGGNSAFGGGGGGGTSSSSAGSGGTSINGGDGGDASSTGANAQSGEQPGGGGGGVEDGDSGAGGDGRVDVLVIAIATA